MEKEESPAPTGHQKTEDGSITALQHVIEGFSVPVIPMHRYADMSWSRDHRSGVPLPAGSLLLRYLLPQLEVERYADNLRTKTDLLEAKSNKDGELNCCLTGSSAEGLSVPPFRSRLLQEHSEQPNTILEDRNGRSHHSVVNMDKAGIPCARVTDSGGPAVESWDERASVVKAKTESTYVDVELEEESPFTAPDMDAMVVEEGLSVSLRSDGHCEDGEGSQSVFYLEESLASHCGYAHVVLVSPDIASAPPYIAPYLREVTIPDGRTIHCLSTAVLESLQERSRVYSEAALARSVRTGPAINLLLAGSERALDVINDVDMVPALLLTDLPSPLRDWFQRVSSARWPSGEVRETIATSSRCFLVGASHADGGKSEFEWRISFSEPERRLARSISPIERKVYLLIKLLVKCYLGKQEPKVVATYHLKTLLFWLLEESPIAWTEELLFPYVLGFLDKLERCLQEHHISSYFYPANNLISGAQKQDVALSVKIVSRIRDRPLLYLYMIDKNYWFAFSPLKPLHIVHGIAIKQAEDMDSSLDDFLQQLTSAILHQTRWGLYPCLLWIPRCADLFRDIVQLNAFRHDNSRPHNVRESDCVKPSVTIEQELSTSSEIIRNTSSDGQYEKWVKLASLAVLSAMDQDDMYCFHSESANNSTVPCSHTEVAHTEQVMTDILEALHPDLRRLLQHFLTLKNKECANDCGHRERCELLGTSTAAKLSVDNYYGKGVGVLLERTTKRESTAHAKSVTKRSLSPIAAWEEFTRSHVFTDHLSNMKSRLRELARRELRSTYRHRNKATKNNTKYRQTSQSSGDHSLATADGNTMPETSDGGTAFSEVSSAPSTAAATDPTTEPSAAVSSHSDGEETPPETPERHQQLQDVVLNIEASLAKMSKNIGGNIRVLKKRHPVPRSVMLRTAYGQAPRQLSFLCHVMLDIITNLLDGGNTRMASRWARHWRRLAIADGGLPEARTEPCIDLFQCRAVLAYLPVEIVSLMRKIRRRACMMPTIEFAVCLADIEDKKRIQSLAGVVPSDAESELTDRTSGLEVEELEDVWYDAESSIESLDEDTWWDALSDVCQSPTCTESYAENCTHPLPKISSSSRNPGGPVPFDGSALWDDRVDLDSAFYLPRAGDAARSRDEEAWTNTLLRLAIRSLAGQSVHKCLTELETVKEPHAGEKACEILRRMAL